MLEELKAEARRLQAEIQASSEATNAKDADGTPSAEAILAQKRLEKLNDDYRAILQVVTSLEDKAASRTTAPAGPDPATTVADVQNTQARTAQLQAEAAERERNAAAGKGRLTDLEVQTLQARAAENGWTGERLALERQKLEQDARFESQRIAIAQAQVGISQSLARNQALATQIEGDYKAGLISLQDRDAKLEEAKFDYQQSVDTLNRALTERQIGVSEGQLAETSRANQAREGQTAQQLEEQTRGNRNREALDSTRLEVDQRNNDQTSGLTARGQDVQARGQALDFQQKTQDATAKALQNSFKFSAPKGTAAYIQGLRAGDPNPPRPATRRPYDAEAGARRASDIAMQMLQRVAPDAAKRLGGTIGDYQPAARVAAPQTSFMAPPAQQQAPPEQPVDQPGRTPMQPGVGAGPVFNFTFSAP